MPTSSSVRQLISVFYTQVWNAWDADAAHRVLHPDFEFRGSLGRRTRGVDQFLNYVADIRAAFPDFHNDMTDLIVDGNQACARLTYTGTHHGPALGYNPTGQTIRYTGLAWFRIDHDRVIEGYVLGDTDALRRQLISTIDLG